ncbi:rod shape-determining protein MreD [Salibacteraceae bacterium]|jgi:rod shape-determining protein MreD|nr:rod shape-determining protein MreD [Salibacteraceae bacterium]HAQ70377.1 rod shape-determining protein MreD [Flavobacteriales bacterium]MDA9267549.1 rod shape-determining protein MreD [Salibacteraceae bacterium]MDB4105866.1 rod shape-determining protein MreD [Salibacteraceae bacterium]MDB9708357.1 rod shape-determining protein MreD [Salibacteraceae bacterium]
MTRDLISYFIRFSLLIIVQIFLLNNVQFSGLLNPYLYVYFLIVLPVDFSPNIGLFVAFAMGIIIDMFSQTMGMHTISAVFLAYARPYILRYMAPRDGYEFSRNVSIKQMGWLWFLTFSGLMVFLHHFVLFFIESFRMSGLGYTMLKAVGSSLLTLTLIIIVQLLFTRSPKSGIGYE